MNELDREIARKYIDGNSLSKAAKTILLCTSFVPILLSIRLEVILHKSAPQELMVVKEWSFCLHPERC